MSEITVACVLRTGERFVGGSYGPEHVRKLAAGVAKHMTVPYRFVCLSDVPVPCDRIPLVASWPGWWSKMEMYRLLRDAASVIYLDLDSLVTGDLAPLARKAPGFTMVSDFNWPDCGNSSVMAWIGDYLRLAAAFEADADAIRAKYDEHMRGPKIGDQSFVHDTLGDVDFFDAGDVVSFKKAAKVQAPYGARVLSFHGRPKCDDPRAGWAYTDWAAL